MLILPQWVLGQQLWTLGRAGRDWLSQRAPISPVSCPLLPRLDLVCSARS